MVKSEDDAPIIPRRDGTYEQRITDRWTALYMVDPDSGLWRVELFLADVPEWMSPGHPSLEEAARLARGYVVQH